MGSHGTSRRSVGFERLLLGLILSLEVMHTETIFGWFGGSQDKKDSEPNYGIQEADGDAAFELDSVVVLGSTTKGKELYEQSTSQMAGHTCWQKAYGGIETNCREILNDATIKSRAALQMTDCFLMISGHNRLKNCPSRTPIDSCLSLLDDHNHRIFLAFFVNAATMCHYLQSEEFKVETERSVRLLKDSAHLTRDKLDTVNVHLDAQHSTLMEHTGYIVESQETLQKSHKVFKQSIQQGLQEIQDSSHHVQSGLEDVQDMQKDFIRKHEELADIMATKMSDLKQQSNILTNSLANVYGSVEDLSEKFKAGREQAIKSLTDLQHLFEDATKQSRDDLQSLSYEAQKAYDDSQHWKAQLSGAHENLAESASQITRNHEAILSKQFQVNDLIMEVLESQMAVQKGWIFESRILRSAGFYAMMSVVVVIATTPKKTRSARLGLYVGLFGTLICEIYRVHRGLEDNDGWLPSNVRLLRYTYCALTVGFLLYSFFSFKDYKVLDYNMLAGNTDRMNEILKEVRRIALNVEDALGIQSSSY